MTDSDWRLQGQERYLFGRVLRWARWWPYQEGWDHDRCNFCWQEICGEEHEGSCRRGVAQIDQLPRLPAIAHNGRLG